MSPTQKNENSLTRMLFGVVCVFLLCNLSPAVHTIYRTAQGTREFVPEAEFLWCFMIILNSSVNFLIYCASGGKFREVFCDMFCCWRTSVRVRQFAASKSNSIFIPRITPDKINYKLIISLLCFTKYNFMFKLLTCLFTQTNFSRPFPTFNFLLISKRFSFSLKQAQKQLFEVCLAPPIQEVEHIQFRVPDRLVHILKTCTITPTTMQFFQTANSHCHHFLQQQLWLLYQRYRYHHLQHVTLTLQYRIQRMKIMMTIMTLLTLALLQQCRGQKGPIFHLLCNKILYS